MGNLSLSSNPLKLWMERKCSLKLIAILQLVFFFYVEWPKTKNQFEFLIHKPYLLKQCRVCAITPPPQLREHFVHFCHRPHIAFGNCCPWFVPFECDLCDCRDDLWLTTLYENERSVVDEICGGLLPRLCGKYVVSFGVELLWFNSFVLLVIPFDSVGCVAVLIDVVWMVDVSNGLVIDIVLIGGDAFSDLFTFVLGWLKNCDFVDFRSLAGWSDVLRSRSWWRYNNGHKLCDLVLLSSVCKWCCLLAARSSSHALCFYIYQQQKMETKIKTILFPNMFK